MTECPLSGVVRTATAVLCRIRPLPLDGPGTEALMVGVVASKMAVLDQTASGVTAAVVDVFVLAHSLDVAISQVSMCFGSIVDGVRGLPGGLQ